MPGLRHLRLQKLLLPRGIENSHFAFHQTFQKQEVSRHLCSNHLTIQHLKHPRFAMFGDLRAVNLGCVVAEGGLDQRLEIGKLLN